MNRNQRGMSIKLLALGVVSGASLLQAACITDLVRFVAPIIV